MEIMVTINNHDFHVASLRLPTGCAAEKINYLKVEQTGVTMPEFLCFVRIYYTKSTAKTKKACSVNTRCFIKILIYKCSVKFLSMTHKKLTNHINAFFYLVLYFKKQTILSGGSKTTLLGRFFFRFLVKLK